MAQRNGYDQRRSMVVHGMPRTSFWTVCTSCHFQFEYLREYVNKRLACKICHCVFVAVETGLAPPSSTSGLSSSSVIFYQANGEANQTTGNGKHRSAKATGQNEASKPRRGRPAKKLKLEAGSSSADVFLKPAAKLAPPIDTRQLLIDKARSEIWRKLEGMRLADEAAAAEAEKRKALAEADKSSAAGANKQPELKRTVSITVPDSDFHDFDQDRSEECFKTKQIWALYDEEDGMPRSYCLIRDIISLKPFKINISYLSSKSDREFGKVNWLDSGFTKSCGSFRVFHLETVEQVNIFSHLLAREKAGRGGCVRIYPRRGDIWAVYRSWSPDWNRSTPDEVRHHYEMVEVLDDYSEDNGICVAPLIKVDGYMTVYRRNTDKDAIRRIPRREMLQFSHQVPSSSLEVTEGSNLPEGCWDLDPAATPDELLNGETEFHNKTSPKIPEMPDEENSAENHRLPEVNKRAEHEKIPSNPPQEECGMDATGQLPLVETGSTGMKGGNKVEIKLLLRRDESVPDLNTA